MRVAVLGDIGQEIYHVGDEAMTHAVGHELARRGHTPVYLTRDLAHTRRHFGDVEVAASLPFPQALDGRLRYLAHIEDLLDGRDHTLGGDDQIHALIATLQDVDALVVAGGGNMSSRYGWLLHERLAALAVAHALGRPSFVTGQTVGPVLASPDRHAAQRHLSQALGVAARESSTLALLAQLVDPHRVHAVCDDAQFLAGVPVPGGWRPAAPHVPGAVVATFAPSSLGYADELLPGVAAALDRLGDELGVPVLLVPHMATPGAGDGDEAVHRRLAQAMNHEVQVLPIEHALIAARRAREASVVITSRYHPAVFATEGGASVVSLAPDAYSRVRMEGALANWGLPEGLVVDTVRRGADAVDAVATASASAAASTRSALTSRRPALAASAVEFWDLLAASLETNAPAPSRHTLPAFAPITVPTLPRGADRRGAPAVSVVMRTRNRPVFLSRALDDVADQSFDDLELIVVNDGGDPGPVEAAVAARAELAGRVRVVHRAESTGMEAASNAGLAHARGEFMVIHDDDDTWAPSFLAQLVAYLKGHPDVDAVAARTQIVLERLDDACPVPVVEGYEPFNWHLSEITIADLLSHNYIVPIGLLYRRRVHDAIGGFDEGLPVVGDWEFNMRLARRAPIAVVGERPLAFWHQRRSEKDPARGNSVFAQHEAHVHFDRLLRDERLRSYLDREGDGALLYLAGHLERLHQELDGRMREQEQSTNRLAAAIERETALGERVDELEARLLGAMEQLAHVTRESGVVALARRKYWGLRARLGLVAKQDGSARSPR